jgi:hypothetical protein
MKLMAQRNRKNYSVYRSDKLRCNLPLVDLERETSERNAISVAPQLGRIATAVEIKCIVEVKLPPQRFVIVIALGGGQSFESFRDGFEAP